MTKYTSGEWICSTIKGLNDCLMVGGGQDGSNIVCEIRTDNESAYANAALISTAPKLLQVLKEVVTECHPRWLKEDPLALKMLTIIKQADPEFKI
jgi:hypothetical protein